MKKIKQMLKKMNNRGSSLVLVIVSTTFLSILVSALLMGVLLAYRLKFYKLNSINNFYAVEQAMDEMYAGLGATVNEHLYTAYTTTAELIVTYDTDTKQYMNLDNDQANELFKKLFMRGLLQDTTFRSGFGQTLNVLESYISDPNVSLLCDNAQIVYEDGAGKKESFKVDENRLPSLISSELGFDRNDIKKITLKNIGVKRVITIDGNDKEYMAQGTYVQSITTDLVLSEPEYNVDFDMSTVASNSLYNYAILADMGLQVDDSLGGTNVTIKGNVYTASDYYNKEYNGFDNTKVTEKYAPLTTKWGTVNESAYSGIYVDGKDSSLTLNSDIIICPGSITAFNGAEIAMSGRSTLLSEVWADNIVIGGTEGGNIRAAANAYIYDDTELNAEESSLTFTSGRYFGYSYTSDDVRDIDLLRSTGRLATGYSLRSHFSDSAVIVNGKDSTLDLSRLDTLYIAGKSYIEFSRFANPHVDDDGNDVDFDYITVEDYSTGQSLDIKSNQLIFLTQWEVINIDPVTGRANLRFPRTFAADSVIKDLYDDFLTELTSGEYMISAVPQEVSGHTYYYLYIDSDETVADGRSRAEEFAERYNSLFHSGYGDEILSKLYNVANYEDFEVNLYLPQRADGSIDDNRINTSGALTYKNTRENSLYYRTSIDTKADVRTELRNASDSKTFSLLLGNGSISENNLTYEALLADSALLVLNDGATDPQQISNFLTYMYINMRDHLSVLNTTDASDNEVLAWDIAGYSLRNGKYEYTYDAARDKYSYDYSITPLTNYVDYNIIFNGDAAEGINFVRVAETITDPNGVQSLLIIDRGDVTVAPTDPSTGAARGIIICGGDVTFAPDVKSFSGLIITGAKVICDHDITLSADATFVANMLALCEESDDKNVNLITRKILLQYENSGSQNNSSVTSASISDISYQDILLFENWKKNVE